MSFSSRITELTAKTEALNQEVLATQETLQAETHLRRVVESELESVNQKCVLLEEQVQQFKERADMYERISIVYSEGVNQISPFLDELRETAKFLVDKKTPGEWSGTRIGS